MPESVSCAVCEKRIKSPAPRQVFCSNACKSRDYRATHQRIGPVDIMLIKDYIAWLKGGSADHCFYEYTLSHPFNHKRLAKIGITLPFPMRVLNGDGE